MKIEKIVRSKDGDRDIFDIALGNDGDVKITIKGKDVHFNWKKGRDFYFCSNIDPLTKTHTHLWDASQIGEIFNHYWHGMSSYHENQRKRAREERRKNAIRRSKLKGGVGNGKPIFG